MVFSSSIFLVYFLAFLVLTYYVLPRSFKNPLLLIASLGFYAWGAPVFVYIITGVMLVDFFIVQGMHKNSNKRTRQVLLWISILVKVGLLLYCKYANFFVENINEILEFMGSSNIEWIKVIMPIGISFFTFQALSYTVDVYRGVHAPLKRVTDYLLYILFFPQLIAGPIVRFNEIANQMVDRRESETADNILHGIHRFILGLSKKVLIANTMGAVSDDIFALDPTGIGMITAWIGALAYTFQIYFDFAGYSDMAIGLGRMFGFKFPENFNNPYVSQNITEFWKRWHITLGAWMRDYLYIPLGGNRVSSKSRLYLNLWLVFIISGFWHGASWNFILWGAFHGGFLILDRLFLLKLYNKIGKLPSIVFTFFITVVGWVIFKITSLEQCGKYLSAMFSFSEGEIFYYLDFKPLIFFFISAFFSFFILIPMAKRVHNNIYVAPKASYNKTLTGICLLLFIVCFATITSSGFNPFIYFRF